MKHECREQTLFDLDIVFVSSFPAWAQEDKPRSAEANCQEARLFVCFSCWIRWTLRPVWRKSCWTKASSEVQAYMPTCLGARIAACLKKREIQAARRGIGGHGLSQPE